jgi:hypothetical protein
MQIENSKSQDLHLDFGISNFLSAMRIRAISYVCDLKIVLSPAGDGPDVDRPTEYILPL